MDVMTKYRFVINEDVSNKLPEKQYVEQKKKKV